MNVCKQKWNSSKELIKVHVIDVQNDVGVQLQVSIIKSLIGQLQVDMHMTVCLLHDKWMHKEPIRIKNFNIDMIIILLQPFSWLSHGGGGGGIQ